jgi:hydrogenase maturation factor
VLLFLPAEQAPRALVALGSHSLGTSAAVIGTVTSGTAGVELRTSVGGLRTLRMHAGELLPRIC